MKVWKETEIQEMLLNQHFLEFPLNIVYPDFYANNKQGYDNTFQDYEDSDI